MEAKNLHIENSISKILSNNTNSNSSQIDKNPLEGLEKIINSHLGKYIKIYLKFLEEEIKKFYRFFLKLEKDCYKQVNSLLINRKSYEQFYLKDYLEEVNNLENAIRQILDLSEYINLNLTAVRKILKKFDKIFELQSNPLALYFFREKLGDSSSNLVYILQFKIIDESSAIMDSLIEELEINYNKKIYFCVFKF
jgi:hypothetical protein